jgi:hypothetical protein
MYVCFIFNAQFLKMSLQTVVLYLDILNPIDRHAKRLIMRVVDAYIGAFEGDYVRSCHFVKSW